VNPNHVMLPQKFCVMNILYYTAEIVQNPLIEGTPKPAFQALQFSLNPLRPLLGILKTGKEEILKFSN